MTFIIPLKWICLINKGLLLLLNLGEYLMKKLLLALIVSLSFTAVMAQNELNILKKAPVNPLIQQSPEQCAQTCFLNFQSCISTAQGTGAWWYCELTFERCMADSGI